MIKEIQNYVNMVNEGNKKAFELKFSGKNEEYNAYVEQATERTEKEFNRLMNKYGIDRLLKEMGFA